MTDPVPPPAARDDGQPARDFTSGAARATQAPDDWMRALAAQAPAQTGAPPPTAAPGQPPGAAAALGGTLAPTPPAANGAGAGGMPAAPVTTVTVRAARDPNLPIGLAMEDASRAPDVSGFFSRLAAAAAGGAAQSLRDLAALPGAVEQAAPGAAAAAPEFAQPLKWSDLTSPGTAIAKAVYQVAHGAPVLAAGIAGGALGGAAASETVVGAPAGALAGGAIGAGAMAAAQALGPYYGSLVRSGVAPDQAFKQAVARAGQDGVFSAAGWALFGVSPFQGAVKNLLLQAFGVQPAASAAEQAVTNLEGGRPVGEGVPNAALAGAVGTALPALGHAIVHAGLSALGVPVDGSPAVASPADASPPDVSPAGVSPAGEPQAATPTTVTVTAHAPAGVGTDIFGEAAPAPGEPGPAEAPVSINDRPIDRLNPSPEIVAQARAFLNGESGDNPIQASLESLTRVDDMDAEVRRLASFMPRDGVQPDEVLRQVAYMLNMDPAEAGSLLRGRLPEDNQVAAFAMLMNSSARFLRDAAQAAVDSGAQQDWAKAVRATVLMMRLVGEWTQAGTDQARAFRARQLAWDAREDMTAQVRNIIANVGPEDVETIVRRVAMLDDPAKVPAFLRGLRTMTGRDGLLYGWYNLLLSNPLTFVKKGISDTGMATFNLVSRYLAETSGEGVAPGESAALFAGYVGSTGDALRAAVKAALAGHSQFEADFNTLDGLSAEPRAFHLANGLEPTTPTQTSPTWAGWQYLRAFLPTSLISAQDDFAKVMNYRAELNAGAWRTAWKEGLTGQAQADRQAELLANVPQALHEQAKTGALANTFQEPLDGLAADLQKMADRPIVVGGQDVPFLRMLLPFIKVPANILKTAFNMTPLPLAMDGSQMRLDLAAGGARRAVALAKLGLGTGIATLGAGLAIGGQMTGGGPSDPELRQAWLGAGNAPYSVRLGDKWYGYRKLEPVGSLLGMIADTADLVRYAHEQDAMQSAASLVFGIGNAIMSATYLEGISGFIEALHAPANEGVRYLTQQLTSMFVPQGVAAVERATDDWQRAHDGFLQTAWSKTPWLAQRLPPATTVWGEPIAQRDAFLPGLTGSGLARLLSPVGIKDASGGSPIERWIWDHRQAFPGADNGKLGFYGFQPTQHFSDGQGGTAQVALDPRTLLGLKQQAGNGLKDPVTGLGLHDTLNALVEGRFPQEATQRMWNNASDEARAQMVLRVFNEYRSAAKGQLLRTDANVASQAQAQFAARRAALNAGPSAAAAPIGDARAAPTGGLPAMPQLEGVGL